MKIETVQITLAELQEAVAQWCYANASAQPEVVKVISHEKEVISIEMRPGGVVDAAGFRHRS